LERLVKEAVDEAYWRGRLKTRPVSGRNLTFWTKRFLNGGH